jgi:hypothetical protein
MPQRRDAGFRAAWSVLLVGAMVMMGDRARAEAPESHFEVGLSGLLLLTHGEDDTTSTFGGVLHLGLLVQLGESLWQLGPIVRAGLAEDGIASLELEARRHLPVGDGVYVGPVLGVGVLFGPGSSSDAVFPVPDLTFHLGFGLDAALGQTTRLLALLRYTQALTDQYTGPFDLTVGLAWDL